MALIIAVALRLSLYFYSVKACAFRVVIIEINVFLFACIIDLLIHILLLFNYVMYIINYDCH